MWLETQCLLNSPRLSGGGGYFCWRDLGRGGSRWCVRHNSGTPGRPQPTQPLGLTLLANGFAPTLMQFCFYLSVSSSNICILHHLTTTSVMLIVVCLKIQSLFDYRCVPTAKQSNALRNGFPHNCSKQENLLRLQKGSIKYYIICNICFMSKQEWQVIPCHFYVQLVFIFTCCRWKCTIWNWHH
jgi:hypothetical protein